MAPTTAPEECDPVKIFLLGSVHENCKPLYRYDSQLIPTSLFVDVPRLRVHFTLESANELCGDEKENKSIIRSCSRIAPVWDVGTQN